MSATNATTNYNFPLFIGTDKPAWLVDWNSAMSAIDAAIKGVDTDVQGAIVDISGLSSTVAAHTSSISTISGQITVITTNLNTATGNINTINSLIGNGTPTTTDQTIIGAINELHANQGDLADLTKPAVSLVAAINAITGGGGAVAASAVSYDNATSGLQASNVQAAIDEVADSENVKYDNASSGLTATNVQAAIDELAQDSVGIEMRSIETSALSIAAGASYNTNLKTLIDADLPAGKTCVGITGFATNNEYTFVTACMYADSNYSLQLHNAGSGAYSSTVKVYYICI